jgi:hypothetical protein
MVKQFIGVVKKFWFVVVAAILIYFVVWPPTQKWVVAGRGNSMTTRQMYRQVRDLDAQQRASVFQFADALPGGSFSTAREPFVAEAYERQMMHINNKIRKQIAANRIPYDEAYDVPTKPWMGNFRDCFNGACQKQADEQGLILGIPSQVGVVPGYF